MAFDEEKVKKAFNIPMDATLPVEPIRVANVTLAEFAAISKLGQPVIITDGFKNWGAKKWSCELSIDYVSYTIFILRDSEASVARITLISDYLMF